MKNFEENLTTELQKCASCSCKKLINFFDKNKNTGILKKCCRECLEKRKITNKKNKCEHDRQRHQCRECKGSSICEHDKRRSRCKDCKGSSICEHDKRRSRCRECKGSSFCDHDKRRSRCRECMDDDQKIEYIQKTMITSSRTTDKKMNRYDADRFIDKCFLEGLFEDSKNCYYCNIDFTYNQRCDTLVTIGRLNNSIGHIKSNCVLACFYCNIRHKSKDENVEEGDE